MNQTIKGKDLMVFLAGKSIALATNHTFEVTANTTDTTTKDDLGKFSNTEVSTIAWSLSSENLVSLEGEDGHNTVDIVDLALAGNKVDVKFSLSKPLGGEVVAGGFTPNTDVPNTIYSGQAVITSVNINAQNGEKATYSVQFTGAGKLEKEAYYGVVVEDAEDGTVSVDHTAAKAGAEITITATPDAGYQVGTISVTDKIGAAVTVSANKFTLPVGGATVSVTFTEQ